MQWSKLGALLGLALVLASPARAAPLAPAEQLNALLAEIKSMTADFKQKRLSEQGGELRRASGRMWIERPGHFRWDTEKPFPQTIVADGDKVWVYDEALEQVTVQKLQQQVGNTPALLLSGNPDKLAEHFGISRSRGDAENAWTFTLTPKDKSQAFRRLQVTFRDARLRAMELRDNLGQTTRISFTNLDYNPRIEAEVFEFEPPDGVDVIRNL